MAHYFPWAARMNPASRNLFCASRPTFRLDGTPDIIIPAKVLELGPENIGEYNHPIFSMFRTKRQGIELFSEVFGMYYLRSRK
uniref:Uncharacterized protein n=1 Tax=Brassica oleracea TaxID=3712 RepID=A0A3P6BTI9_BRAOL|nr:unnamed protein product [Brassica oleracea]